MFYFYTPWKLHKNKGFLTFSGDTEMKQSAIEYAFSEFAVPSYKWGKVACLQCKSYKFGPLGCGTTCNLIPHVCLFLITRPLVHHKNKSNGLGIRLWQDLWFIIKTKVIVWELNCDKIFHIKLYSQILRQNIRVWPWMSKRNLSWQTGFQAIIFDLINQPEVWWWE